MSVTNPGFETGTGGYPAGWRVGAETTESIAVFRPDRQPVERFTLGWGGDVYVTALDGVNETFDAPMMSPLEDFENRWDNDIYVRSLVGALQHEFDNRKQEEFDRHFAGAYIHGWLPKSYTHTATSTPVATLDLPGFPYVHGSMAIRARDGLYVEVEDILESGPNDKHFMVSVDPTGLVTVIFGDNVNGKYPPAGSVVISYLVGGFREIEHLGVTVNDDLESGWDNDDGVVFAFTDSMLSLIGSEFMSSEQLTIPHVVNGTSSSVTFPRDAPAEVSVSGSTGKIQVQTMSNDNWFNYGSPIEGSGSITIPGNAEAVRVKTIEDGDFTIALVSWGKASTI